MCHSAIRDFSRACACLCLCVWCVSVYVHVCVCLCVYMNTVLWVCVCVWALASIVPRDETFFKFLISNFFKLQIFFCSKNCLFSAIFPLCCKVNLGKLPKFSYLNRNPNPIFYCHNAMCRRCWSVELPFSWRLLSSLSVCRVHVYAHLRSFRVLRANVLQVHFFG